MDGSQPMSPMPRYKCHKEVWALKVSGVRYEENGSWELQFDGTGFSPIRMDGEWCRKHDPVAGGYYVVYEDGYKSFSPAKAFEEGYTKI